MGVDRRPRPPGGTAAGRPGRRHPRRPGRARSRPRRRAGALRDRGRRRAAWRRSWRRRPRPTGRSRGAGGPRRPVGSVPNHGGPGRRRAGPPARSSRATGTYPGRACSASRTAAPPHEWPNPNGRSSPRWSITVSTSVAKPDQAKSPSARPVGAAVGPQVEPPAAEAARRGRRARGPNELGAEAGGVDQQQVRARAPEVVDGDADPVGRGAP